MPISRALSSRYPQALQVGLLIVALALLLVLLSSCASTAPQPKGEPPVQRVVLATPAECLKSSFKAFSPELSGLPTNYITMSEDGQAQTLLANKQADGDAHRRLLAQALRCAPEK